MALQFLLHLEFNVVGEKLILLLYIELAGAHLSCLSVFLILLLDMLGSHDMIDAELA